MAGTNFVIPSEFMHECKFSSCDGYEEDFSLELDHSHFPWRGV